MMDDTVKALSLATIIGMSPPQVQKVLMEEILKVNKITFPPDILKVYEEYWSQAIKNYNSNYLHK